MRIFLIIALALVALLISARSTSQVIAPTPYNSNSKINFVRTWETTAPITHADTVLARPIKDVRQSTEYMDGLGRAIQTVTKKGSLVTGDTTKDMVTPVLYDEFARETYSYPSFVANSAGSNSSMSDGLFKLNPFQQDSAFCKGMFPDESYYYNKTIFEASPLDRTIESFDIGDSWVGTAGESNETNRKSVKSKFWLNTSTDSVRIWTVTDVSNAFGTYATDNTYAAGQLNKTITIDEQNNQIIEFTDKDDKIILRKNQLTAISDTGLGKGHYGWLCTYFIYDDFDNLRCVIQPAGVELLRTGSWTFTSNILNELTFRYEYDGDGRQILKQAPGAGKVYFIYDARDRLVMSQDSLLRAAHQWLFSKYDSQNRVVATGLITDNTYYNNAAYHRDHADTSITYPNLTNFTSEILTKTFYDDYDWRSSEGNPLSDSRSNNFDTYLQTASNTVWPYPQSITQSKQLIGLVTGSKTKILGTNNYLYTVNFYDDHKQLIQSQETNITGGTDIVTTQFAWNGRPLVAISKNEKLGANSQTTIVLEKYTYDDLWRVIKTEQKASNSLINSGNMPSTWTTISQNEYDAISQLKVKRLENNLDSLKFDYNIGGSLLGMNRAYVKDTMSAANYFGFDLGYDKTAFTVNGSAKSYSNAQTTGNIAGTLWKSTGDDRIRKYDFTYDAIDRLTGASFNQLTNGTFSTSAGVDFTVSALSFDLNGNISSINQKGWKLGGSATIDSLLYTYNSNSNKLKNVLDRKNDTATLLGDFRSSGAYMAYLSQNKTTGATDYEYDGNGNLTVDRNKDISLIHYNTLNYPDSIVVANKGNIKYVYDAEGNKLKKITTEGSKVTTTLYLLGNYINDTLQFIPHSEGRLRPKDSTSLVYDFFIKDHLGNTRMVLTNERDTSFYPPASMEGEPSALEEAIYSNVSATRVDAPDGYPEDTYTDPNKYVCQVDTTQTVGTGIVLKVMAGDKFNFRVSSWYTSSAGWGVTTNPLTDIISALSNGIGGITNGHSGPTTGALQSSGVLEPGITTFLNNRPTNSHRVKGYVNWLLFDEQFNMVTANSGAELVGDFDEFIIHTHNNMPVDKNGYLYIFVSNDNQIPVYFDNLQVTHIRGPLLEETHYYPFGLTMNGISSKALLFGEPQNKFKYNGIEKENDLQIEIYDAQLRELDAQVGRWWQVDPETESMEMWSPYASNYNNPILYLDPLGNEPDCCPEWLTKAVDYTVATTAGFVNGTLHGVTGGRWPIDPFNYRDRASPEVRDVYNASATVGVFNGSAGLRRASPSLNLPTPQLVTPQGTLFPPSSISLPRPGLAPAFPPPGTIPPPGSLPATGQSKPSTSGTSKGSPSSTPKKSSAPVNGNSASSKKAQHNYDVKDTWSKKSRTVKNGTSSGKINQKGQSYRGQSQASRWNRKEGTPGRYTSKITNKIPAGKGARQKALNYESNRSKRLRASGQLDPKKHKRP